MHVGSWAETIKINKILAENLYTNNHIKYEYKQSPSKIPHAKLGREGTVPINLGRGIALQNVHCQESIPESSKL